MQMFSFLLTRRISPRLFPFPLLSISYFYAMNLKYFVNKSEGEFEILLHGIVGEEIDGREVAAEIHMLNQMGAKVIKERINTIGGSVVHAFSIVSANLTSDAEIHTFNEGVADSAGSFILASGNKGHRGAFDFSTMMVHNPLVDGVSLDEMEDSPLKKDLSIMRDSIVTILSNNSGKTSDEIKELMNKNTRMTAKEAKKFGFIDFVEKSENTPLIKENMSLADIMNVCHDLNNPKIENKMKEVLSYLNLSEDAKEISAVKAIKDIDKRATEAEGKVETLNTELTEVKNQVTEKDTEITELQAKVDEFEVKDVENAVKSAIDSGKFAEENKESLTEQCKSMGVDNFNSMVDMIQIPQANAIDLIKNINQKSVTGDKKEKELADKFQNLSKTNPDELKRIELQDPKEFEAMYNAWEKAD
jgi:ATP-dependent Clp protease protease subunit